MTAGYIYLLKNNAFGPNVLKIGLTTRTPDQRAREIYAGSTGVPMPFQVAVAYSVADCHKAEKLTHARLKVYRLNNRREFFRLPLATAAGVVHEVCVRVNEEYGTEAPVRCTFTAPPSKSPNNPLDQVLEEPDASPVYLIPPWSLRESPVRANALSEAQRDRANILFSVISQINPLTSHEWLEGFMRDEHPERELRIWEHIALAYLTLEHADDAPETYRKEAFALLLQRTWESTEEVLSTFSLKHFSKANAKRLLDAYDLCPKPIAVSHIPRGAIKRVRVIYEK